jgi:uncharacterized protein YeaO (DUF488 family)
MLKAKHFMDAIEPDDGCRLWVEPIGLTRDLRQWCQVHGQLVRFGPPRQLWEWFEERGGGADAYEFFRGAYHVYLSSTADSQTLSELARQAMRANFTLLHQGLDPQYNTATALHEFVIELQSYCPPD